MPRRADPRAGFTLIEVLAALAVTAGLVAIVLPYAGRLVARWRTGQQVVERADGWMQVIARMSDDFAEALPMHAEGGRSQDRIAFQADGRTVRFIRPALGGHGGPGLQTVTYAVVPSPDGDRLLRQVSAFRSGGTGRIEDEAGASATLVEGGYRIRFAFAGRDGRPVDQWMDKPDVPNRVELLVTGRDGAALSFSPVMLPLVAHTAAPPPDASRSH